MVAAAPLKIALTMLLYSVTKENGNVDTSAVR